MLHVLLQLRVALTLGGAEEIDNSVLNLVEVRKDRESILDLLAGRVPFLTAALCESLLQASISMVSNHNKLSCLLTLLTLATKQQKSGMMEPIVAKMA
jgi:hypothetical protein